MTYYELERDVMAGPKSWNDLKAEAKEFLAEGRVLNWAGMREEWSDTVCFIFLFLMGKGLPVGWLPILPGLGLYAAKKFNMRLYVWQIIFDHHGVQFEHRFTRYGGNYMRLHKVRKALEFVGREPDIAWLHENGWGTL